MAGNFEDLFASEFRILLNSSRKSVGTGHEHPAQDEGLGEESPLRVGEAQGRRHWHVASVQRRGHRINLPGKTLKYLGAVAPSDKESLVDLEPSADVTLFDEA